MRPRTTPTPIPAEAATERRVLWVDGVEAEAEEEVEVETEVEVDTAAALLDGTEAEYMVMEMPDVPDVDMEAVEFDREDRGVLAESANGVVVVDKVIEDIVEANDEAGEDSSKVFVL